MATVKKQAEDKSKPIVIQNFVVGRAPQRTQFDIASWRNAIDYAEADYSPNRYYLYDIYADAMLDPHLSRQWEKRVENITNTKWMFVDHNGKEVDDMMKIIDSPRFEQLLKECMETISHGISVLEFGSEVKKVMGEMKKEPTLYSVPRKHIRPEKGVIVREQYDSAETASAIRYREGRYVDYVTELGSAKDFGILLNIVPYVILKKGGVSDWALFVQLFGQPFREYRYDGYDESVRLKLEDQAQKMASAPYIILPDGASVTLHEIKNNNTGQVHSGLTEYCDKMISIRVLGNTLTSQQGNVGSLALGEVHQDTQDEVFAADKQTIRRMLNHNIVPILYNLGFPVAGGSFIPREEKNSAKVLERLKVLQMVKQLGEPVDADLIYQEADVPKPENYDTLKQEMEAQAADPAASDRPGDRPDRPAGRHDKGDKKPKTQKLTDEGWWNKLRVTLADFFDPAP